MFSKKIFRANLLSTQKNFIHKKTITLIPGDGIGKETTDCVVDLFKAANLPIEWEKHELDMSKCDKIPDEVLKSIERNKVAFTGPLYTPVQTGHNSVDNLLAKQFGLFAYVVPITSPKLPESVELPYRDLNMTIVRENTEGEYTGLEHIVAPGIVESLKIMTKESCQRIATYAFKRASRKWGSKVIAVHKANIMKQGDGLFLETCREVSKKFPDVPFEDLIVDNCAMQLVNYPHKFHNSVLVTPNLYGSIVTNIAAGLVGGPGVTGGYCEGTEYSLFSALPRHVAYDIAGKGIANPLGTLRASYYMLTQIGMDKEVEIIKNAIRSTLKEGKILTKDLGGNATTKEFMKAIISNLKV